MKKKKEPLSDLITNEAKRHLQSLKMVTDPEFNIDQNVKVHILKLCGMMMVQLFDDLEEGALPLLTYTTDGKQYIQLMKNARTANERLMDVLYKEETVLDNKGNYFGELFDNGGALIGLIKHILLYMACTDDRWRYNELIKKIDDLVPDSLREERINMCLEELRKGHGSYTYEQLLERKNELEKQINSIGK